MGTLPNVTWNSNQHTNQLVPFYAEGQAAKLFARKARKNERAWGKYLDNTDIAKVCFEILHNDQ